MWYLFTLSMFVCCMCISGSLALLDHFFLLSLGLVNILYQFCSANPHFLGVNNWPLMASDKQQRVINWCEGEFHANNAFGVH